MTATPTASETAATQRAAELLLEARGISKNFPGVRALHDVNFEVRAGQVHALVGENGAGKSTLMKVLAGIYQPDAGQIRLRGEPVTLPTPLSAQHQGISVIHQEFFLMNHLSVAQNLYIGREPQKFGGLLNDDRELNRRAHELMARLRVKIDPRVPVGRLSVAEQQLVEIAKALSFSSKVLIMDEPTAALTGTEVATLFRLIDDFVTDHTAVVYISHRMEEIRQIASHVTVLRDGELVDSRRAEDLTIPEIIRLMVGRSVVTDARPEPRQATAPVLEVSGLSTATLLKDVSFTLDKGEILGFAGLMGAGRTETARALIGEDEITAGTISITGAPVTIASPRDAVERGIGYLSEDRKRYGLLLGQDVTANTVLASIDTYTRAGLIQDRQMRQAAKKWVDVLGTKTPTISQRLRNLSGGNQQKVVIAKWLERDCDILIFDEPTRWIDVGAKQEIYDLLRELTTAGKSIIMISSELEEIMRMSDRIAVMCDGRITGFLSNQEATQEKIMELATTFDPIDELSSEAE
ncbi:MAG: sugar ABC transporter ATP-binding protein [Arachnia sp.]